MRLTQDFYYHELYSERCIVKKWFLVFGKRLFVLSQRPATDKEKAKIFK